MGTKSREPTIRIPFFGKDIVTNAPKGRSVTYAYLQEHISQRYAAVKRLLGVESLTSDVMISMIRKVFEDHEILWDEGEPSPIRHRSWYKSFTVGFASRGGVKSQKLKQEGHVPKKSFKTMKHTPAKKAANKKAKEATV